MRASSLPRPARAAAAGLVVAAMLLSVAGARADDPAPLRQEAERLATVNGDLAEHARAALLELYALDARAGAAERKIGALGARVAKIDRAQASARRRLAIARAARQEAERQLGQRLRALYVEGAVDPIAVLLGAESLNDALSALDGLDELARQDRRIIEQVSKTSAALEASLQALAARESELRTLVGHARTARAALATARLERTAYLEGLALARRLNNTEIERLVADAAAIEERAHELARESEPASFIPAAAPASDAGPEPAVQAAAVPGNTITVTATGYALQGSTATGMPVGWGVVAVDPAVIPLGARMTIPGYGEGVAADTGSAVRGAVIDLWFPSVPEALGWGTRTVTITLH